MDLPEGFKPDGYLEDVPSYNRFGGNGSPEAWQAATAIHDFKNDCFELYSYLMDNPKPVMLNDQGLVLLYNMVRHFTRVIEKNLEGKSDQLRTAYIKVHEEQLEEWLAEHPNVARAMVNGSLDDRASNRASSRAVQFNDAITVIPLSQSTSAATSSSTNGSQTNRAVDVSTIPTLSREEGSVRLGSNQDEMLTGDVPHADERERSYSPLPPGIDGQARRLNSGYASPPALVDNSGVVPPQFQMPMQHPTTKVSRYASSSASPVTTTTSSFPPVSSSAVDHLVTVPMANLKTSSRFPTDFIPVRNSVPRSLHDDTTSISQQNPNKLILDALEEDRHSMSAAYHQSKTGSHRQMRDRANEQYRLSFGDVVDSEDLISNPIAFGQTSEQATFFDSIKMVDPLGGAYDEANKTWLLADTKNNRVLSVDHDGDCFEYVGFQSPSAICVVEPGKRVAILSNDKLQILSYELEETLELASSLNSSCRGLTISKAGNLMTLFKEARTGSGKATLRIYKINDDAVYSTTNRFKEILLNMDRDNIPINPCFLASYKERVVLTDLGKNMLMVISVDDTDFDAIQARPLHVYTKGLARRGCMRAAQSHSDGGFQFVSGVQMDNHYRVLVVDALGKTVQLFSSSLEFLYRVPIAAEIPYTSGFVINNAGEALFVGRYTGRAHLLQLVPADRVKQDYVQTDDPRKPRTNLNNSQGNSSFNRSNTSFSSSSFGGNANFSGGQEFANSFVFRRN